MAKQTPKVEIPTSSPDEFIALCESILVRHAKYGNFSPLNSEEVALVKAALVAAKEARTVGLKIHETAEKEMQKSRQWLGIDRNQSSMMHGTPNYFIHRFSEQLLSESGGKEETLKEWGFRISKGPNPYKDGPAKRSKIFGLVG